MRRFALVLAVVSLIAVAVPATAQQTREQKQPEPTMSPEQAAMMAAWEKAMTPGPAHRRLAEMAGDFTFTSRMWMEPGAPPQESTGTASSEMVLGGRYALARAAGKMMGMDFEGMGLTGYDNVKGKYVSTWVDNMGTGMLVAEGVWDSSANALVLEGDYADPMTGTTKHIRMVTRVVSKDHHIDEFWETGPDGKPVRTMEIDYRRK